MAFSHTSHFLFLILFTLSVTVKTVNCKQRSCCYYFYGSWTCYGCRCGEFLRSLHGLSSCFLGVFALVLAQSSQTSLGTTLQDGLAILVQFQLDDQHLAWVDAHVDVGAVRVLTLNLLNVDDELLTVGLHYLANLVALVVATDHLHFVVTANGHRAHVVFLTQLLGQGGGHQTTADV